ncbi:HNH endonuclease [Pseudomonas sp. G.S.17]|uniref:HNH endonuclease n=1 Tax=Pseudomonas sp. G.S.17 TaxID=3137451 RepID=UPI00311C8E95
MALKAIKSTLKEAKGKQLKVADPTSWRSDKSSTQRGYGYKWQQARAGHLRSHPLCAYCQREGRVTEATVVDHSIPHRGDMAIFWDKAGWVSLCTNCHSSVKQREEKADLSGI